MQKPKGKSYGSMMGTSAGVSDGLSESMRFKPDSVAPATNAKSQRVSPTTPVIARGK